MARSKRSSETRTGAIRSPESRRAIGAVDVPAAKLHGAELHGADADSALVRAEQCVRDAAIRGASAVTCARQVVSDAAELALSRWEEAVLHQRSIDNLERWAYRVGVNAARAIGGKPKQMVIQGDWAAKGDWSTRGGWVMHDDLSTQRDASAAMSRTIEAGHGKGSDTRRELRAELRRNRDLFRGRQFEVALFMCKPEMSVRRAARELQMDRTSLRRSLSSAMKRLEARKCPLPPS